MENWEDSLDLNNKDLSYDKITKLKSEDVPNANSDSFIVEDIMNKPKPMSGSSIRHKSHKAEKLFNMYPHLKKYKSKQIQQKGKDEPQQSSVDESESNNEISKR